MVCLVVVYWTGTKELGFEFHKYFRCQKGYFIDENDNPIVLKLWYVLKPGQDPKLTSQKITWIIITELNFTFDLCRSPAAKTEGSNQGNLLLRPHLQNTSSSSFLISWNEELLVLDVWNDNRMSIICGLFVRMTWISGWGIGILWILVQSKCNRQKIVC